MKINVQSFAGAPTLWHSSTPVEASTSFEDDRVYQRLVQSITGYAIYMLDPQGIVTTWNAGAQWAKGYASVEIVGQHFGCFYSAQERQDGTPDRNLEVARTTVKYEAEGWRVRKDGSRFWAHVVIDALRDDEGVLFGFAKITRDCTGQRMLRDTEIKQDQHFRFLIQGVTTYAICMLDVDGVVINWNVGAEQTMGFLTEEIVGTHFSCFYTIDDQQLGLPARGLNTARGEGKFETEAWRVRKDSSQFWAQVLINPIFDDEGFHIGFAMVTRDCTAARQSQEDTRGHERRFRLLVEGVTDYAIYMLGLDGTVSNWNAGAQRAKGYVASEIVGKHFSCFYTPEDRSANMPALGLEAARRNGKHEAQGWRVRKDGTRFWAHVVIQPIYDDAGSPFGYAKVTRDCTEQRATSLSLAQTTRNLDLAMSNMDQGLCLFDKSGDLVLHNARYAEILGIEPARLTPGMRFQQMLGLLAEAGDSAAPDLTRRLRRHLLRMLSDSEGPSSIEFRHRERSIHVSTRVLKDGGWVSTVEDVTEQRETERRVHHLAHHDLLTGLPNRVDFVERIKGLLAKDGRDASFVLLYLDLDRFKAVNDTLGHYIGDQLLKSVSARLSAILRNGDHLSRLGGDEFTIVLDGYRSKTDFQAIAERCIYELSRPFDIVGNEVSVGVSIGIVVPRPGLIDADILLQQADLALYKAKREGRNCFRIFEPGTNDPMRARHELEEDLRRALEHGQLELHYQPIINADTGEISACEALLRWDCPRRGNVPPAEFIPVAEERGLMPELGAWILRHACEEACAWPESIRLSVNVSPAQLLSEDFTVLLASTLAQTGLQPARLDIEITETALLENSDISRQTLEHVRAMGVGVSMDDFGTGYSSLSLLQSFPFSRIKIDRSFVQGIGHNRKSMAIVQAITGLCRTLGIPMIAEGVETLIQRDVLVRERCQELQGFWISRPLPHRALQAWINDRQLARPD
jgi:diguanylate cyclase (GGDEF)-like protein/PAS domain S-box-containing protein